MNRPHRAWLVCLGGALTLLSTIGLGVNVFAVYQPEILALEHFTNAQGSLITTVRSLFILVALLTVNRVCARLGLRRTMTLGVLLIALSCFCFGAARAFWQYCAAAAFTGLGYCYGGMVPLSLLIGRWFRARRNLALGLASAGSGVASIVASPLVVRVIEGRGLQAAFWLEGAALVVLAGVVWLLVRSDPAQLGLEPLGGAAPDAHAPVSQRRSGPPAYLPAMAAGFLIGGMGGPGYSHLTVHYATLGYAPLFLAGLVSASGVGVCVGKVLCGQIYDRWGSVAGDGYCYLSGAGRGRCCAASPCGKILWCRCWRLGCSPWGCPSPPCPPLCGPPSWRGRTTSPGRCRPSTWPMPWASFSSAPCPGFWRTGRAAISRPISSLPLCSPWPSRWCAWPMPEKSG